MKKLALLFVVAGCSGIPHPPEYAACDNAPSVAAGYGTPDNLGPCIGTIHNRTVSRNQTVLMFEHTMSKRPMIVHWWGNEIISMTLGE